MKLQTRKILWLVTLLVLLALNVYVGSQSRSWKRQAKAYAELSEKLEAILIVDRQLGKIDLSEEPTFPGSQ